MVHVYKRDCFVTSSYVAVFDRHKARLSNKKRVPCFSRHIHPVGKYPSTPIGKSDIDWMSSSKMMIVPTVEFLHCLQLLLLSIVLSLYFFPPPLARCVETAEQGVEAPSPCSAVSIDSDLAEAITFEHNYYRSMVDPVARNMMRMYWSEEMVRIARESACNCRYRPTRASPTRLRGERLWARENHGIHEYPVENPSTAVFDIIEDWFAEGENFRFNILGRGRCTASGQETCEHYIHMVWAEACEVGCVLSMCSLRVGLLTRRSEDYYLLVCAYGSRFPRSLQLPLTNGRPYRRGLTPCSSCRQGYEECGNIDPPTSPLPGMRALEPITNLCYSENGAEACIGSDPHFAIKLPGGSLLCYNFQGLQNATFNLISNDHLVMNARFVPDNTTWDNTWLGSIGVVVFHEGRKIEALQFTAANQLVTIGGQSLDAREVKELSFSKGRLSVLKAPFNHTLAYPRVHVEFDNSRLDFTVRYIKNDHLNLYWHNAGAAVKHSNGVIGQFFNDGVNIDIEAQLLHVPGRLPVPVEKQHLWKFMEQSFHRDSMCWTSAYHTNQGAGIVAGTYKDYIVDDLLSTQY